MKNYYAILEVPVGCGVAEIRQAYRRLVQENLDNEAVFADLKEAHEVLTTPARRTDYDRAVWGETFAEAPPAPPTLDGGGDGVGNGSPLTPPKLGVGGLPAPLALGGGRCPMGTEAQCPVLLARVDSADTYCPECGYLLAGLNAAHGFEPSGAADAEADIRLEEPGGRSHRLRPGLNTVGRESADVLLPDKTVSRQHARLEVGSDGTVTLEDLSSTNGTQVGSDVLVPHIPRTLQSGDQVRFGSIVTELRLPSELLNEEPPPALEAEPAGEAAGQERPAADGARVYPAATGGSETDRRVPLGRGKARAQVVETREAGGRAYPLVPGVTTFGRRAENSVIIQGDPYVSGSHAQIIADGDVFRLTDIGSTNGTLLNGRRLAINEPETLSPDDVILIGGTAMRFEMLDVSAEADAEEEPQVEAAEAEAPEAEAPEAEAPETEPQDVPAEPRQRTAQEYDIPDEAPLTPNAGGAGEESLPPPALGVGGRPGDSPTHMER